MAPSGPMTGASMANTSRSKRPSAHACAALRCEASPKASASERLTEYFSAMRSAARELVRYVPREPGGERPARPVDDIGPSPTLLMASTPHADGDLDSAAGDEARHEVIGLLRRAALAVDGGGGDLVGKALARARPCE